MISHHNAVNTILDINDRYQITEQDTAFGISNLHFDLSVYDVFGILGAGGKLVLPDPEYGKDPAHWIHWLNHENITLCLLYWISMYVDFLYSQKYWTKRC